VATGPGPIGGIQRQASYVGQAGMAPEFTAAAGAAGLAADTAGWASLGLGAYRAGRITVELIQAARALPGEGNLLTKIGTILSKQYPDVRTESVWKLGPGPRGEAIEKVLGQNLPNNFPIIDRFENGLATSIKSMDLSAKTYQNPRNLIRVAERYIDLVKRFRGAKHAGISINEEDILSRGLELAIPRGGATIEQKQILDQIIEYGRNNGVTVKIIEVY